VAAADLDPGECAQQVAAETDCVTARTTVPQIANVLVTMGNPEQWSLLYLEFPFGAVSPGR
jgi:hypothetical protein